MTRRSIAGLMFSVLLLSSGCNPFYVPFFLLRPESKLPPGMKDLATDDKEKAVKVAVIAWSELRPRQGLLHPDRELAAATAAQLNYWVKYNKQNVKVVGPSRVEVFKNEHPNWKTRSPQELAKQLEVDYLIYLEVHELNLFEKGSSGSLFRGNANVKVTLANANGVDEFDSSTTKEVDHIFPKRGPKPVDFETSIASFKAAFYASLGDKIAWQFTSHPTRKDFANDRISVR